MFARGPWVRLYILVSSLSPNYCAGKGNSVYCFWQLVEKVWYNWATQIINFAKQKCTQVKSTSSVSHPRIWETVVDFGWNGLHRWHEAMLCLVWKLSFCHIGNMLSPLLKATELVMSGEAVPAIKWSLLALAGSVAVGKAENSIRCPKEKRAFPF